MMAFLSFMNNFPGQGVSIQNDESGQIELEPLQTHHGTLVFEMLNLQKLNRGGNFIYAQYA